MAAIALFHIKATIMPTENDNDVDMLLVPQRLITWKSSIPSGRAKPDKRRTVWQMKISA
jgi:hypothetical protein